MRLADAPDDNAADAAPLVLPRSLLRDDPRLVALYAPFQECMLVSELLIHDGTTARTTRQLIAEVRGDSFDSVCAVVREVCARGNFDEQPTELDDVAAGTEWKEHGDKTFISVYRNFGGSTALHVRAEKVDPPDATATALRDSPLSAIADVLLATSWIEHVSCSRCAGEAPRWHLQAALREGQAFTAVQPALTALGFEDRRGKYWQGELIVRSLSRGRWLAALPGIDFA